MVLYQLILDILTISVIICQHLFHEHFYFTITSHITSSNRRNDVLRFVSVCLIVKVFLLLGNLLKSKLTLLLIFYSLVFFFFFFSFALQRRVNPADTYPRVIPPGGSRFGEVGDGISTNMTFPIPGYPYVPFYLLCIKDSFEEKKLEISVRQFKGH